VQPWSSAGGESVRTIRLAPVDDNRDAAALQARSRELALAIAELIRRFESAQPSTREPAPSAPAPSSSPTPEAAAAMPEPAPSTTPRRPLTRAPRPRARLPVTRPRPAGRPETCWQLGVTSALERFSGGRTLVGGDLFAASCLGRWISAELRAGARVGDDEPLPNGRLTIDAADVAVGSAFKPWPQGRTVETAIAVRVQGYLARFRAEQSGEGHVRTSVLGALTLAVEPRLEVALAHHLSLAASGGVGYPLRGIVVRVQGAERDGLSGSVVSANLGIVFSL
jgi:hypothetical protein